jgi:hypothetical protein
MGICQRLEGATVTHCLEPVGDGWNADNLLEACDDDWLGDRVRRETCPADGRVGSCSGWGAVIGGDRWDDAKFLVAEFHYTGDAEAGSTSCQARGGQWAK